MFRIIFFIVFSLFTINSFSQFVKDESYKDESFYKFKTELTNSIIKKDLLKFKTFLADVIYESNNNCGYPGCNKKEFVNMYFNDEKANNTWSDLLKITRFGFYRKKETNTTHIIKHDTILFKGPSYLKKIKQDKQIIVLAENVNIRKEPSLSSEIIKVASFERFNCDCNINDMKETTFQTNDDIDWIEIRLKNDTTGYIAEKYTSYSLSKELTISKINNEWKIISFYNPPGC